MQLSQSRRSCNDPSLSSATIMRSSTLLEVASSTSVDLTDGQMNSRGVWKRGRGVTYDGLQELWPCWYSAENVGSLRCGSELDDRNDLHLLKWGIASIDSFDSMMRAYRYEGMRGIWQETVSLSAVHGLYSHVTLLGVAHGGRARIVALPRLSQLRGISSSSGTLPWRHTCDNQDQLSLRGTTAP